MRLLEWLSESGRRFFMLFSRRERFDRELEEEMRLHRDLRARELREEGTESEDANYAAQRRFGNRLKLREEIHQAWGWTWLDRLVLELRYAARRLRHSPGFTTVAVLTLALGIGANTAIFTLIQQVMLSPLPVAHAKELYSLGDDKNGGTWGGLQGDFSVYSYPLYQYVRDHTPEFSELAAFSSGDTALSVRRQGDNSGPAFSGETQAFRGEYVSGNYFITFGVNAAAGRLLEPRDDQPGAAPVAVMSYRAWHDKFASAPQLIGETLIVKGLPVTLVGVTTPEFFGDTLRSDPPDMYLPLNVEAGSANRVSLLNQWNEYWLYSIGRLRPDVPPARVQAHVTEELRQWLTENYVHDRFADSSIAGRYTKDISKQYIQVLPAAGGSLATKDNNKEQLRLLMIISALVLLIACANIANLLLARGTTGRVQTAVRVALGASRGRILRQTVTEGLLLAVLGGAAGLWVAMVATQGILHLAFANAEYIPVHATPSFPVLGFALGVSLFTGVIFSAAPAWIASRTQPTEPLRAARSLGDHAAIPQKLLVVLQAGVSLVLLVAAGLLTLSLRRLETQPLGIDTQGRLMAWISPHGQYPPERLEGLYRQFEERLSQIPGVVSVSFSHSAPMFGFGEPVSIEGKPRVKMPAGILWPEENRVSAHYFETVGTRVLRGRPIDDHDTPHSHHVAVVDETFVRLFFPGEDPIGKRFGIQTEMHSHDYEIVGVVEPAMYRTLKRNAVPTFFLPLLQEEKYEDTAEDLEQLDSKYVYNIQLRVNGRAESFKDAMRRALSDIDPDLTVVRILNFDEQVSRHFDQERMIARLTLLYGVLALLLASVGLYGVASYAAARRTNEIGIRMALGADRGNVIALMLRTAMRPIMLGLALGIPAALLGARLIASQLFDVKSYDPFVFGTATVVLALFAIAAAYLPARRAASIDPMQALRAE
jgi:predicted permease